MFHLNCKLPSFNRVTNILHSRDCPCLFWSVTYMRVLSYHLLHIKCPLITNKFSPGLHTQRLLDTIKTINFILNSFCRKIFQCSSKLWFLTTSRKQFDKSKKRQCNIKIGKAKQNFLLFITTMNFDFSKLGFTFSLQ